MYTNFLIKSFLLVGLLSVFSCTKGDLSNAATKIPTETDYHDVEANDRVSCAFKIKVNSVSPSNARYILSVTNTSNGGDPLEILSKVPSDCGQGIENDAINQWYNFSIPSGANIKVQFAQLSNAGNCLGSPNGGTISYTIQGPPQPYPNTNTITKTLTWYNGSPITFNEYSVNSSCSISESGSEDE